MGLGRSTEHNHRWGILECASWGTSPDKAPTIVLLHEGLGCVAMWKDFPQKLGPEQILPIHVQDMGGLIPLRLRALLITCRLRQKHVTKSIGSNWFSTRDLGHSDVANCGLLWCSVSDQRIRGLILMAPHFFTENGTFGNRQGKSSL